MRISDWSSDLCASDLLVIGALEEGGIDRRERPHSLRRQPGGECYRMLFGDADVKTAFGVRLRAFVEPRPRPHRGGDRDDAQSDFSSEERSIGQECFTTCSTRRSPSLSTKQTIS